MLYVCQVPLLKKWEDPEEIKNILDDLDLYKDKIVGISLNHSSIGEKCAKAISEKLKLLKNLRKVELIDCFVSRTKEELPISLKYILDSIIDKDIRELNLSDNALGPDAEKGYINFFENNKTLVELYLNNNGMGPEGTEKLMEIINKNKNMNLEVLSIARNKMEEKGCKAVSNLLKNKKCFKHLKISDNEIGKEGLLDLLESLKENPNINYLDISNNTISDGIYKVSEILPFLKNLIFLNLSDITPNEDSNLVKNIIQIIPNLIHLRYFYFEYNISDLDLRNSSETEKFIEYIFDSLLKLNDIKEIKLGNNEIPKSIYEKYKTKFEEKNVYLFSCYGDEEEMDDIIENDLDNTDLNKK